MMILMFIMLKIVPAFQKIFEDFRHELPPMTQTLISVAELSAATGTCCRLPLLVLLLLFYAMMR